MYVIIRSKHALVRARGDVEAFFNDCYEKALPLTEEDLELFDTEPKRLFVFKRGESADSVPIQVNFDDDFLYDTIGDLLEQKKKERFYIMHLSWGDAGQREECWEFAIQNDLIGLSNAEVYADFKIIREDVIDSLSDKWLNQFDTFCMGFQNSIEIGDLVCVLWGQTHLLGIAEVLGDHEYHEDYGDDFFDHVRPVDWIVEYDVNSMRRIPTMKGFVNTLDLVRKGSKRWLHLSAVKV